MGKVYLEEKSKEIRRECLNMVMRAQSGHLAPALSCADIITALFFEVMNIDPANPKDENRDRFILSAGHKCLALYAALAKRGFFPEETFKTYVQFKSILGGHPDGLKIPGVEISTGSLGHGLPIGIGMALAARYLKRNYRTYVLLGDGEIHEGSIWEAASAACHYKLDNIIGIIDHNKLCADGPIDEVMSIRPLNKRWEAFGWSVIEIDGHNMDDIVSALKRVPLSKDKPTMIIANTIKGKGVSCMENKFDWHSKVPTAEQAKEAFKELA
ncbi:MAG: transketolase [Planctomycetes bacterium]|nr:transketolase [Planctomycetota bacterium]